MTPEIKQLMDRIAKLEGDIRALKNTTTIPREVEQAFRDRFRISTYASIAASNKTPASESQSVNEGGVASYNVLKLPDGFDVRVENGSNKYYPYYL